MRVCVVLEYRFARTPDGTVWARLAFDNAFFHRYLQVFDAVRVIARVEDVADPPAGAKAVEGDRVCFSGVPYYHGLIDGLRKARAVRSATIAAVDADDAVIFRVPSFVSAPLWRHRLRCRRPYGVEVVGDPWDVFAPGAVRTPLRPLMRRYFARQMRGQCAKAAAAAYVTSGYLQSRYPCPQWMCGVSDVRLGDSILPAAPRRRGRRVLFVGSLDQPYKGADVLIAALAAVPGATARIVGDGRYRPQLQAKAAALDGRITFAGTLPSEAVRAEMDAADLFVLSSRTEGLPRVLLEAMARGMPAVASCVGGVPELLDPQALVPPGNANALADRIRVVLDDPAVMDVWAARNLAAVREFEESRLEAKRRAFYARLRKVTEAAP